MSATLSLRQWAKRRETPAARLAFGAATALRGARVPVIRPLHRALYAAQAMIREAIAQAARIAWWTPLFLSHVETPAPGLRLDGGMPQVLGPLRLRIGRDCRINGRTTFAARPSTRPGPVLEIGDNVGISWMTSISVGTRVVLGNNVRIAQRCFLAGYPGHPLDAADRAAGLPCTPAQIGDIVLEDDVWLGTGVMVMPGVRIGRGTVVAAGSVVTRDLPPFVVAGGMPAKVIRELPR
jgi:acetyltransferase-like isoleucine patch superfamily enzyme